MATSPWRLSAAGRAACGVAGVAALLSLTLLAHASARLRRANFPPALDQAYLPPIPVLRVAALGHGEALADLLWIDGLSRYGEQTMHGGSMSWLGRYFDAISALDPHFKAPYQWCGVAAMYNHDFITNESVWQSTRCLELGRKQFPDDWLFPFEIGSNYMNELKTTNAAQRRKWRALGASYIEEASLLPGAPPWLASAAANVHTRAGETEVAVRELEQALAITQDPTERQVLESQLAKLRPQGGIAELAASAARFERQWKATAPYVPPDLFALIGVPDSRPLDPHVLGEDALARAVAADTPARTSPASTPASESTVTGEATGSSRAPHPAAAGLDSRDR